MKTSFKQLLVMFMSFFVAQVIIVYSASMFFPGFVALGTHLYSSLRSVLQSVFLISLIAVGATPVIELLMARYKIKLQDKQWLILYFVINAVAVWVVARFAELLGFGISSWVVAVVLGLVFGVEQGLIMKKVISEVK